MITATDNEWYNTLPLCERCKRFRVVGWKWSHGPCICYSCANSPWMNEDRSEER